MSAFVANGNRVRIPVSLFAFLVFFCVACQRDVNSYSFDDAGEEAQKAIAANVEFTLTEDVFQKWEKAQANLDRLPSNVLDAVPDPGGNDPVARGIGRLEGSPRARQAIESAGLSVRNFVLATVALAQAVKASQGGVPPTVGAIAANVRFVIAHGSRIGNRGASVWVPPSELSEDEIAAQQADMMDTVTTDEDIATGAEGAQPTVPQLEDWSRNQPTPSPPQPTLPRPRESRTSTQPQPQVLTVPPPPPTRDSSSGSRELPPKTDSLTVHQ